MKKLLTVLICLLTIFSLYAEAIVERSAEQTSSLPAVGDVVDGFVVTNVGRFDLVGCDTILYEHIKTGAQVLYLANEDTNRVFEIGFKTPAETDTGVPHVFEHSTLDGSKKYPSKTLFFNLSFQTYNTYMNASTYPFMTVYPIASLSEDQLLKYADFYTDSCFNPMVASDKSIFDEEAWRYALDEEGNLTIEGTVYSEMLGSYTRESAANFNFKGTIFPGSIAGNSSGGNPDHIPEMTWEDIVAYHEEYYTPSNSVTCIYGKIDNIDAFLELLDGYFSEYEKTEYGFVDAGFTPITEPVEATYEYAVEASTDTEKSATVYYGYALGELTEEELTAVDFLSTLIGDSSSILMENLKTAIPYGSFACYIDFTGPESILYFYADNINEEDAATFKQTVDDSLAYIYANGFDQEAVDAIIASFKLSIMLTTEGSEIGIDTIPNILYYWAGMGNLFGYMNYIDAIEDFNEYVQNGTLLDALKKYVLDNNRTALATTKAVAGLKEVKDAALAEKLAEIKASMTEEELAAIAASSDEEETEEVEDDKTAEYVKQLQAVTVESLPEEYRVYNITDETGDDGIRRIFAQCDTTDIGYATLMLNADWVEQDMLHFFKLYIDLLGDLDTTEHTRTQLSTLINRYLYDITIKSSIVDNEDEDEYYPFIRVSFIALDEDMEKAYDVVGEILFDSQFDVQRVADTVSNLKQSLKSTINNASYNVIIYDMLATADDSMAYYAYMNYLDYYNFLDEVSKALEENPEAVIAGLQYIQQNLANSYKAISAFAGSEKSKENHQAVADAFIAKLDHYEVPAQEYEFETMGNSMALIVDSNVNFNFMFASYEDMGLEEYTADLDAISSLINDNYLLPMLRDQYGVYGAYTAAADAGIYLYTYRDPNIMETFQVYAGLPEYMATLEDLDQETLDGYILSSYSGYATPSGELTGALNAILNHISKIPQEKRVEYMQQLKSITAEKVADYASAYSALVENGIYATSGGASAISNYAGLYEEILNPFGVQDSSSVVLSDITEGDSYYEAVRFAFENGFMATVSDSTFGVNDSATLGDLAAFFYMMIGGGREPETAISFLSQYGILPADPADTVISRTEAMLYTYYFCQAVGYNVSLVDLTEVYPDADQIPEGYESLFGFGLEYGLLDTVNGLLDPMGTMTRAQLAKLIYGFAAE